jgi:hypothetical protein
MFQPCLNWQSSGWMQCPRNYIPTLNTVISDSVSAGGGGQDLVYEKQGVCVFQWWEPNACINHGSKVHPLLVVLAQGALVSRGGQVSQWSAVVTMWSFRVEQGGGCRCAAVDGGSLLLVLVSQVGIWHQ